MNEKRIAELMKSLDCTREEAIQVIADDEAIDSGEKLFELTAEQKKAAKEMTAPGTRKHTEIKRERKPNETKQWIMNRVKILFEGFALTNDVADVTLSNAERTLDFIKDGKNYTLTLTEHRPPKK